MLNLRQLEILSAVVQFRTTVGAAEQLGMSQPSISNTIRHIESVLGFPLFERKANRLIPTEETMMLLEDSEPLFMLRDAVNQRAADLRSGRIGRVRIASTAEISEAVLPRVIAGFARQFPQIWISLETRPLESVMQVIENGLADVAFFIAANDRQTLNFERVAELRAVCICPEDHVLAGLEVVTPLDLPGHALIGPRTENRIGMMIADSFRAAGMEYRPSIETRFMNASSRIVGEGWGVAVVDELSAHIALRPGVTVRPFESKLRFDLVAATLKTKPTSRQTKRFINAFGERVTAQLEEMHAAALS